MTAKVFKKTNKSWKEVGTYSVSHNKKDRPNKILLEDLPTDTKLKVRVRGTWKTSSKGPYHGKWSIAKPFKL